jgi:hypothetical protein
MYGYIFVAHVRLISAVLISKTAHNKKKIMKSSLNLNLYKVIIVLKFKFIFKMVKI